MYRKRVRDMEHLDTIRKKKNITIEKLCKDICNVRQYSKYKSGENSISEIRLVQLLESMNVSTRDFYFTLHEKDNEDFNRIKKIYSSITNENYIDAKEMLDAGINEPYLSIQNTRLFEYCRIRYLYDSKKNLPLYTVDLLKKQINIKNISKTKIFDYVDILFLLLLAKIEVTVNKTETLDILIKILKNPEMLYFSPEKRDLIAPMYSNVCVMLGKLGRYEEMLVINSLGIDFCKNYSFSRSLTKLYECRAITLNDLERFSETEEFIVKCYANSLANDTEDMAKKLYIKLVKKFNKSPVDLLMEHIKKSHF